MDTPPDVGSESKDEPAPEAGMFTNSRSGARRKDLRCMPSEDAKSCALTHKAAGWDVDDVPHEHVGADSDEKGGRLVAGESN